MTLPVPTQSTWTVGEIVTAALMNKNVRDAVGFLEAPPIFVAYQATVQSIPNNTTTAITMDTEIVDSYNGHSTTTNSDRYVAQVAGWYLVLGQVSYASTSTSGRRVAILNVNGSALSNTLLQDTTVNAAYTTDAAMSGMVYLNVGDYVQLKGYQGSGAALSTASTNPSTLCVLWVHS